VLLCSAIAWTILQTTIIRPGSGSNLAAAVQHDVKGKALDGALRAAIPLAFVHELIADAIYVSVALMGCARPPD